MYTDGQERAKVGRVSVDIKGKSYRLRFTYPEGKRHEFSIARVSTEGWSTALRAAQLINRDIDLGDFDSSFARYSPKHAKSFQIAEEEAKKEYSLKELWEMYKEASKERVAPSTRNNLWKVCDNLIEACDTKLLSLNNCDKFVEFALKKYAVSTVKTLFRTCINPCVNSGVRQKLIRENPYSNVPLPKAQKTKTECFEPDEVKAIIEAFYSDDYVSAKSRYLDSYYAPMVEFLALTGCRPEECHALTWNDIKTKGGRRFIKFSKVYTKGELINHTKTHTIRLFPCNNQLNSLLDSLPRIGNENNLIFPSYNLEYINQDNFRNRYWHKILKGLVKQGAVAKSLKPYCLRHSFITRLVREGVDTAVFSLMRHSSSNAQTSFANA
jgi:integrase